MNVNNNLGDIIAKNDSTTYRRRLEFLTTAVHSWLEEVEGEIREATGILGKSEAGNTWWAERIKQHLVTNMPPSPVMADEGEADTLLEIAFWSGWLKGEQETLQRLMAMHGSACLPAGPGFTQTSFGNTQPEDRRKNDFYEGLR